MNWSTLIEQQKRQDYFRQLEAHLASEDAKGETIYPAKENIFAAFEHTPFEQVKVVILGQDPYHGAGQAHGLSFSVLPGIKVPPSLRNIYKELALEYPDFEVPEHGYLKAWAEQGVLLINSVMTVREGQPNSHQKWGWDRFTDAMIKALSDGRSSVVFLLWGAFAQKKQILIDGDKHHILTAPHPSPFSANRGFFGCNHFIKTNDYLTQQDDKTIDWRLPKVN